MSPSLNRRKSLAMSNLSARRSISRRPFNLLPPSLLVWSLSYSFKKEHPLLWAVRHDWIQNLLERWISPRRWFYTFHFLARRSKYVHCRHWMRSTWRESYSQHVRDRVESAYSGTLSYLKSDNEQIITAKCLNGSFDDVEIIGACEEAGRLSITQTQVLVIATLSKCSLST